MRKIKPGRKLSLNAQTLKTLNSSELSAVHGGYVSGVKCYASDVSALFGITTTGTICPNDWTSPV
jgi:natural product precursor